MGNRKELLDKIMEAFDKNYDGLDREMFEDLVRSGLDELSDERVGILHFKFFPPKETDAQHDAQ